MRRQLPIPRQAESRRYPPLGKRIIVGNTGSPRAGAAADVARLLAEQVGGWAELIPVPDARAGDDLLAIATQRRATLVVLPLGGSDNLLAIAEQEMTIQAVHRACVPILAVSASLARLPRNAILAIDFSDASARAASAAMKLLAASGVATLMHVNPDGQPRTEGGTLDGMEWSALMVRGARRRLELMERRLSATTPCAMEIALAQGDPAREILSRATLVRADLIALGGASRGMLHRILASSLTTRVLRGAGCSVLVAPELERPTNGRAAALRRHRDRD